MHFVDFYNWFGLNQALFFDINRIQFPLWDNIMLTGTKLGNFSNLPWVLLLLCCGKAISNLMHEQPIYARFTLQSRLIQLVITLVIAYCGAAVLVTALKLMFNMPRPYMILPPGSVHVLATPESKYSFPSGHSTFAILLATVFWPYCQRALRTGLVIFALWVGLSRICVGVHFPVDVLAGYICGFVSGMVGRWLCQRHVFARWPRWFANS